MLNKPNEPTTPSNKLKSFQHTTPALCVPIPPVVFFCVCVLVALWLPGWAVATVVANDLGAVSVARVNGETIEGAIETIDSEGAMVGTGLPADLNIRDVLSITTDRVAKTIAKPEVTLFPVGGGKLFVQKILLADEKASFQSSIGINQLPLQAIRACVWSSSPLVEKTIKQPSKENDQVIVQTSDSEVAVEGILESIDATHVHLNYQGESQKISLEKVKAIVTADLGGTQPSGASATLAFVEGTRLVGTISALNADELTVRIVGGAEIKINPSTVVTIAIASDRLQYLSDLEPTEVQEKSIFAVQLPWQRDRSVGNNPMSMRKDSGETITFEKGLGMQAFCRLAYSNTKQFDRFIATVGMDSETVSRGDCQMVVRGDGIELWSQRVRGSDGPREVDVDISGMKDVVLIVYPGEEFDLGDHANWGNARFLKTK